MFEKHYPPYEQLMGLHYLLAFLSNAKIHWHEIWTSGDIIKIKTEPPRGDFDLRIFYIYTNGKVDSDGFRED